MKAGGAGFTGFRPAAFEFLRGLAANNEKPWFEANRAVYEREVKQPCAALAVAVSGELDRRELPLSGDAKRSAFRIHRDTRFSRNKQPFKTEIGTVWFRQGGGKNSPGVLYFHLSPHGCFAAAAFYMPDPEILDSIREAIRVRPQAFLAACAALREAGLELSMDGQMTRLPRGYEDLKGSEIAGAVRLRSFVVSRPVDAAGVTGPGLVEVLADMARDALPLLRFGWGAVDEVARGLPAGEGG